MSDRLAYLDALGIPAYVLRQTVDESAAEAEPAAPQAPEPVRPAAMVPDSSPVETQVGVNLGPGDGSCLFLAGKGVDEASPLASDLARVLAAPPVWGKLSDGGGGQRLELVIAERLFTHVVVFGEAAARLVFGAAVPEACGPARVIVVDDFPRLASDAGARRSCWLAMKSAGVVASP